MSDLTHVELVWLEKRIENWIRFGHPAEEQILDRRRRIVSFAPGSIFAFVNVQVGFDPSQLFMALAALVALVAAWLRFPKNQRTKVNPETATVITQ